MSFVATTITEHYINQGKIEGKIETLEDLFKSGMITYEQMQSMIAPLKQQLQMLMASGLQSGAALPDCGNS